jgi:hypothetical protein
MAHARALIRLMAIGGMLGATTSLPAQESKTPSDSELVSLAGCAKGRVFTVRQAPEHEPQQSVVAAGRRFRLNGQKDALKDIRAHDGQLIEVTGLVRKSDLKGPGGIAIAGGRIRIGGPVPRSDIGSPGRDPQYNVAVLDVSAWRQLGGDCKGR